jgi:hypothetical protein
MEARVFTLYCSQNDVVNFGLKRNESETQVGAAHLSKRNSERREAIRELGLVIGLLIGVCFDIDWAHWLSMPVIVSSVRTLCDM